MHSHLHTTDIRVGGVYTNGNGLYRRVTELTKIGSWADVTYSAYRRRKDGQIVRAYLRGRHADLSMGLHSFAEWARREATEAETEEVRDV